MEYSSAVKKKVIYYVLKRSDLQDMVSGENDTHEYECSARCSLTSLLLDIWVISSLGPITMTNKPAVNAHAPVSVCGGGSREGLFISRCICASYNWLHFLKREVGCLEKCQYRNHVLQWVDGDCSV